MCARAHYPGHGSEKMRIYVTHCTARKDDSLRGTGLRVAPDRLYRGKFIEAFRRMCRQKGVEWAIFSDLYGVWLPCEKHEWYEKHPSRVGEQEYQKLLRDFKRKLCEYDDICFYRNPSRVHKLHKRLLRETGLRDRITEISSVKRIF